MVLRRAWLTGLALLALLGGSVHPSLASLVRGMSLSELVGGADRIVVGTVRSVSSAWDAAHRRIHSTIAVDVEEDWKGPPNAGRRLEILQPGGIVGDIEMTVQGMPDFAVGERSLLFLRGQTRCQVVGMAQGKRRLVWSPAEGHWLAESPNVGDVVQVGPGAALRRGKPLRAAPLEDLREQVMRALGPAR